MIDNELTKRVKAFLVKTERSEEEIKEGALMLLQLNRNRPMYNTIVQRPRKFESKVVYELNKFLPSREDGLTINEVVAMEKELRPQIEEAIASEKVLVAVDTGQEVLPYRKGKRADHDQLPEEILAIWPKNAERWKKIKEHYNIVEELSDPCEKYEHLKAMKDAWYQYKADFCKYDEFVPGSEKKDSPSETAQNITDQKAVSNARSYITKNLPTLIEMTAANPEKAEALRQKVLDRVKLLVDTKQEFKADTIDNLLAAGIDVKAMMEDE